MEAFRHEIPVSSGGKDGLRGLPFAVPGQTVLAVRTRAVIENMRLERGPTGMGCQGWDLPRL